MGVLSVVTEPLSMIAGDHHDARLGTPPCLDAIEQALGLFGAGLYEWFQGRDFVSGIFAVE